MASKSYSNVAVAFEKSSFSLDLLIIQLYVVCLVNKKKVGEKKTSAIFKKIKQDVVTHYHNNMKNYNKTAAHFSGRSRKLKGQLTIFKNGHINFKIFVWRAYAKIK